MSKYKHIATLMALAIVMPELVTGSTNLFLFFNPVVLLILILGYGIAVLLIRDYAVRYNLNYLGLLFLGFAYLILNEGLLAKTLTLSTGIPFSTFDNYGIFGGIAFPWMIQMGLWHALYSVIFPIIATHFLFPEMSRTPWLSKKVSFFFLFLALAIGVASFFGPNRGIGSPGQLLFFFAWMGFFVLLARYYGKKVLPSLSITANPRRPFWYGMSTFFLLTLILPFFIVQPKLPVLLYLIVYILGIIFYIRLLHKKVGMTNENLLLFMLGGYTQTALTGALIAFFFFPQTFPERLVAEILILIVTYLLYRKVAKNIRAIQNSSVTPAA